MSDINELVNKSLILAVDVAELKGTALGMKMACFSTFSVLLLRLLMEGNNYNGLLGLLIGQLIVMSIVEYKYSVKKAEYNALKDYIDERTK